MPDLFAQTHQTRVRQLFGRYGETLTLTRSGVDRAMPALFAPLDGAAIGTYFDANEAVGLLRPALAVYVSGAEADPPLLNDVFTRDGRGFTVLKTYVYRQSDLPLLIVALCD